MERLDRLSREQADFFADPAVRNAVQGLHEQVLLLPLICSLLTVYSSSELEAVVLGCEAKYLAKRSMFKKIKKILSEDDVYRDLTHMHQHIQKAYFKWMVRLYTKMAVQRLMLSLQD